MNHPVAPPPPPGLAQFQAAFGAAISTPFLFDQVADDVRTQPQMYDPDLVRRMVPRPDKGMNGSDRLAIYNQQYWFRLLNILQKEFPLLRHLIGVYQLNQLASAYLTAFPSTSPSLRHLSDHLPQFLDGNHDWNLPILHQAVALERIYIQAFDAAHSPVLNPADLDASGREALLEQPLRFQPHWFLFAEDWELVSQRARVAHDPDDQIEVDVVSNQGFWVIYRHAGKVTEVRLGPIQYELLKQLHEGQSLASACERVAEWCDEGALNFMQTHIQSWFAHWISLEWFVGQP